MRNPHLIAATLVSVVILTAAGVAAYFPIFYKPLSSNLPVEDSKLLNTYNDSEYFFEFEYPSDLTIERYSTGLTFRKNGSFFGELRFPETYIGQPADAGMPFIDYSVYFARMTCEASGIAGNVYCSELVESSAISNDHKIKIFKLLLREVEEPPYDGSNSKIRYPLFIINVEDYINDKRVILVDFTEDNANQAVAEEILKTFRFTN